jgi:hypothetical protein
MSALAIALQGVGYAPLVMALQGFAEVEQNQASGGGFSARTSARRLRPTETDRTPQVDGFSSPQTQEAPESQRPQAPVDARERPRTTAKAPQGSAAQMLRAELAQIETRAREREARVAALQAQMSADAGAAERAELLAARKRDNNRRAQILIALLMLD